MHKKAYLFVAFTLASFHGLAQTTYLPLGSDDYLLLDRMETRSGRLCDSLRLSDKAESRKNAVSFLEMATATGTDGDDSGNAQPAHKYSKIDLYNMRQMIGENGEWAHDENGFIKSKHPFLRKIYKDQYNMAYVKTKDFFLAINPVLNMVSTVEQNSPVVKDAPSYRLYNSHDLEFRGWIGKKIGFYTLFTDNQEGLPAYVYNYAIKNGTHQAVPGADYYLPPGSRSGNFDYLMASGYIDFAALKDHVNITFGTGKHFIGDGIYSLFLSDFSANTPFLRLRTRVWRLDYESIFLELTQQYTKGLDAVYGHKYASVHYISYNAARWLNVSYFESVVFQRSNGYEVSYLNPVALTFAANGFNGGGDKALIGFSFKAIAAKHLQFYGQAMLNEFKLGEMLSSKGWYGNKWGIQLGGKYFDAFGIKNLDLQAEVDAVRPYAYSAKDTFTNYTNYNQPLADPLGSGFVRAVGILRYQPIRNFTISVKSMYYVQGVDTGNVNYGNDIFKDYTTVPKNGNYGVKMINGPKSNCAVLNLNLSLQVRRNFFIDAGTIYRNYENASKAYPNTSTAGIAYGPLKTTAFYLGIRINSARRDYSFF